MSSAFENAELAIAFQFWAKPRGYDLTHDGEQFQNLETRAAWLGFEAAHGPDGCRPKGQQLYALIKRTSEYAHQTDKLFPVRVGTPPYGNFAVHGGPGGVYPLKDVTLFVMDGGSAIRLS